jgi:hypothetical protein
MWLGWAFLAVPALGYVGGWLGAILALIGALGLLWIQSMYNNASGLPSARDQYLSQTFEEKRGPHSL